MRLKNRMLAAASTATLAAGLVVAVATPASAATVTYDVSHDVAQCNTLSGSISFTNALHLGDTTTGNTIKVKAAVAGCFDTSSPISGQSSAVKMFKGTLTSTLTSTGTRDCVGLSGLSATTSGSSLAVWTPAAGQKFIPTTLVGAAQKPTTTLNIGSTYGDTFAIQSSQGGAQPSGPWTGVSYGEFEIGAIYGTTPGSATTDFTGPSHTGAASWFAGTTQQDTGNEITTCISAAGLKTITFGLGALQLG